MRGPLSTVECSTREFAQAFDAGYATIKHRIFGHPRLLMRGLSGAQVETGLATMAYNLKRSQTFSAQLKSQRSCSTSDGTSETTRKCDPAGVSESDSALSPPDLVNWAIEFEIALAAAGEPEHVGEEEEKQDQEDGHQIHVEHKEDTGVIEIPSGIADTAVGVGAADEGDGSGNEQQQGGAGFGKAGEKICGSQAKKDKHTAAQGGVRSRIEDVSSHAFGEVAIYKNRLSREE